LHINNEGDYLPGRSDAGLSFHCSSLLQAYAKTGEDAASRSAADTIDMKDHMTIRQLFSSKEFEEYLRSFSGTLHFDFHVYDEDRSRLLCVNGGNPFCKSIRSAQIQELDCPGSCSDSIFDSLSADGPVLNRCRANIVNFAFPVERLGETVFFVGTGGFAAYDDLLGYMKIARDNGFPAIPAKTPLSFPGEEYVMSVARYVHFTISNLVNGFEERQRLEEKLLRMTSLFDSQAFSVLTKNRELLYRYVLDTVEFVFGSMSAAFMVPDETGTSFRSVCSAGKYRDALMGFHPEAGSAYVDDIRNKKSVVFVEAAGELLAPGQSGQVRPLYFFPIITGGQVNGVIAVLDRIFPGEDLKIMNAFRDYLQLNLENHRLRKEISRKNKADKKLMSFIDFSSSLATVSDREKLMDSLLEKTIQLLNAEQGSLMLLDHDTSELVVEAKKGTDDIVQDKMRIRSDEGIAGLVLERGEPFLVEDIEKDPRVRQANRPRYKTKSFLSLPIKIEERLSGVLNISDKTGGGPFNRDDLRMAESFINNVSIAIEKSFLYRKAEELQKLSITDPLTGIYNRRYLNRRLAEEITRYNRYKHPFSFMMLDLDKFKEYNDTYGHLAGDNLIRSLATVMENSLRTIDIAARFGGDEFVAIFPQTPKVDAIQITNRLKEKIDRELGDKYAEMPLSVSMGLATFPDDASSIMELIEKTDQALYLAKKGGGNRVVYL